MNTSQAHGIARAARRLGLEAEFSVAVVIRFPDDGPRHVRGWRVFRSPTAARQALDRLAIAKKERT